MNKDQKIKEGIYIDDRIDFIELFKLVWTQRKIITSCTALFAIIAIIYSLSLPNLYTSKALLMPSIQNGNNNLGGNVNALASLAGINLSGQGAGNEQESIAVLTSFSFFKNSILPNIFLPDLVAAKSWDSKKNILRYDRSVYNVEESEWDDSIPTVQDAYIVFEGLFSVESDLTTGFVSISIKHVSPYIAKSWLDIILSEINETTRLDQKKRASLAVKYLNEQMLNTSLTEIKQQLSALVQKETEKLMLVEANEDYVYRAIDPPIVPQNKSEPSRTIIVLVSTMLGGIFSLMFVFFRYYLLQNNQR